MYLVVKLYVKFKHKFLQYCFNNLSFLIGFRCREVNSIIPNITVNHHTCFIDSSVVDYSPVSGFCGARTVYNFVKDNTPGPYGKNPAKRYYLPCLLDLFCMSFFQISNFSNFDLNHFLSFQINNMSVEACSL